MVCVLVSAGACIFCACKLVGVCARLCVQCASVSVRACLCLCLCLYLYVCARLFLSVSALAVFVVRTLLSTPQDQVLNDIVDQVMKSNEEVSEEIIKFSDQEEWGKRRSLVSLLGRVASLSLRFFCICTRCKLD